MTYYTGRIVHIVFENASSAFYVLRMTLDQVDESPVIVRGSVPAMTLHEGSWLGFDGEWVNHPKFGRQIAIKQAPVLQGEMTVDIAVGVLSANGINYRVCQALRSSFTDDNIAEALLDIDRLEEVLSEFEAALVSRKWRFIRSYFHTLAWLNDLGFPSRRVQEVWSTFGEETETVLSSNPWALVKLGGIDFKALDEIAMKLGLSLDCEERVQGAAFVGATLSKEMGHVFLPVRELFANVRGLIPDAQNREIAKAIGVLSREGSLVVEKRWATDIYTPWLHVVEEESARLLVSRASVDTSTVVEKTLRRLQEGDEQLLGIEDAPENGSRRRLTASVSPTDRDFYRSVELISEALCETSEPSTAMVRSSREFPRGMRVETLYEAVGLWCQRAGLEFTGKQAEGILNGLKEPVSILTGLPGTGKTTSLKVLVQMLQEIGERILLVSPTGIAARRLQDVTGAKASTVHRAFKANIEVTEKRRAAYVGILGPRQDVPRTQGSREVWGYSEGNPYPADVLIADESSMIDIGMLYRILTCTSSTCRLVFVGDAAQLASVGPGNVLHDMISSKKFPTVSLTKIFRQEEASDIVRAAHAIHAGDVPCTPKGSDFSLIPMKSDEGCLQVILTLSRKLHAKGIDFQVVSPKHAGVIGVTNLNECLREELNPPSRGRREVRIGAWNLRQEDKVMVVKNDYEREVYNGDMGVVTAIDTGQRVLLVDVMGPRIRKVSFSFSEVGSLLRLAYATTIHKSQGQEYDVIIMPIVKEFGRQLQRNLIYTAVTRARSKVFLVGSRAALSRAVNNNREDLRNTRLVERLNGHA